MTATLSRPVTYQTPTVSPTRRPSSRPIPFGRVGRVVFLSAIGVYFLLPMIWMVLAPTKTREQFVTLGPFGFGSLSNYGLAFEHLMQFNDGVLLRWLWNSVWYSVVSVTLAMATVIPAGYALARTQMKFRRTILLTTLVAMVTPGAARTIPLYLIMDSIGWLNTPAAVIVPAIFYPTGVWLSYIYFSTSISPALLESARLDGCSEFQVFRRIALPLASPLMGLIAFFSFVAHWADFFGPYIMLNSDSLYNLPVGLASLMASSPGIIPGSQPSTQPIYQPEIALAGLIVVAPIVIVFIICQRYLTRGIFDGAVKD